MGTDTCAPLLSVVGDISRLGNSPGEEWFGLKDVNGQTHQIHIDRPYGDDNTALSYCYVRPRGSKPTTFAISKIRHRTQSPLGTYKTVPAELHTQTTPPWTGHRHPNAPVTAKRQRTLTLDETRSFHERLLHPGRASLAATLQHPQRGYIVTQQNLSTIRHECAICDQRNTVKHRPPASTTRPGHGVNESIQIDYMHIKERGLGGEQWIFTLVDPGCANLLFLRSSRTRTDGVAFLEEYINLRGAPAQIICDNAKEFGSKEFKQLCAQYRIQLPPSPPYISAARGNAENTNRLVRRLLRTAVYRLKDTGIRKKHWPLLLPGVEEIHNKTVSRLHGISPWAHAHNGLEPSLDYLLGDPVTFSRPISDTAPKTLDLAGTRGFYVARTSTQ
mgnify:CR=1 FL=1